jgi:hypothetical protein
MPTDDSIRAEAKRRYGGAVHTDRNGMITMYPSSYQQQLMDAFIDGYKKSQSDYFKLALSDAKKDVT